MRHLFFIGILLFCLQVTSQVNYFSSFDDAKIAYTDEGEGEAILLIHGFLDTRKKWDASAVKKDLLAKGYRVIVPDLRGNGDSDKPQDDDAYTLDAEILDLMFLMVELRIRKYKAVGYSRGSILLARLMTKDKRLKKAVLGGMGIDFTNRGWKRRRIFRDAFNGKVTPETQSAVDYAKSTGIDFRSLYLQQKHQPVTTKSQLAQIKIKVLVLANDTDLESGSPEALHKAIPKSKLKIVSGDHNTMYKNAKFSEAVIEFF